MSFFWRGCLLLGGQLVEYVFFEYCVSFLAVASAGAVPTVLNRHYWTPFSQLMSPGLADYYILSGSVG